jgi:hypothetical protein
MKLWDERTIHFGLRGLDEHLTFGGRAIDVSESFLADFVERFEAQVQEAVNKSGCDRDRTCDR